jgi:hypothetical protein
LRRKGSNEKCSIESIFEVAAPFANAHFRGFRHRPIRWPQKADFGEFGRRQILRLDDAFGNEGK